MCPIVPHLAAADPGGPPGSSRGRPRPEARPELARDEGDGVLDQRRVRAAFGVTRRMPDQSLAAEMLLVWESPAVGATSVTSPGSTCPGRPDFGTSSHTTP